MSKNETCSVKECNLQCQRMRPATLRMRSAVSKKCCPLKERDSEDHILKTLLSAYITCNFHGIYDLQHKRPNMLYMIRESPDQPVH